MITQGANKVNEKQAKTEFVSGGVLSSPSPSCRPPPPPSFRPPPPPMSPPAILTTHDLKDKDDSDDDGEKIREKSGPEKSAKEIAACAEEAKEKEEKEKEKEEKDEEEKKEKEEEVESSDEEESEWEWTEEEEEEEEGEEWEAKEESWQNILSTAKGPTTFKAEFSIKIPVK
jgi:hypothetical protein